MREHIAQMLIQYIEHKATIADVKTFGLGIEDLEEMFTSLGYKLDFNPQFGKAA